jgi:hypothetical protein
MSRLIKLYGSVVSHFYNNIMTYINTHPPDSQWRQHQNRVYLNQQLKEILHNYGIIEFLIFLYDFVIFYGVTPVLRSSETPDFVAEVLAETSVDITDKAAILAIEKLTD